MTARKDDEEEVGRIHARLNEYKSNLDLLTERVKTQSELTMGRLDKHEIWIEQVENNTNGVLKEIRDAAHKMNETIIIVSASIDSKIQSLTIRFFSAFLVVCFSIIAFFVKITLFK